MATVAEITAARNAVGSSFTSISTASFTPNGSRVLFIVVTTSRGGAVGDATLSGNGGASALTPTRVTGTGSPALANREQVWTVTTPSSPSSMSFTASFGAESQLGGAATVYEASAGVTEADIIADVGNGANSSAPSIDIGSPAGDSTLIGFLYAVTTSTITAGTDYTPLTAWSWLSSAQTYAQYDETASADGVIDASLGASANWHFIGVEIQAIGGGGLTVPVAAHHYRQQRNG